MALSINALAGIPNPPLTLSDTGGHYWLSAPGGAKPSLENSPVPYIHMEDQAGVQKQLSLAQIHLGNLTQDEIRDLMPKNFQWMIGDKILFAGQDAQYPCFLHVQVGPDTKAQPPVTMQVSPGYRFTANPEQYTGGPFRFGFWGNAALEPGDFLVNSMYPVKEGDDQLSEQFVLDLGNISTLPKIILQDGRDPFTVISFKGLTAGMSIYKGQRPPPPPNLATPEEIKNGIAAPKPGDFTVTFHIVLSSDEYAMLDNHLRTNPPVTNQLELTDLINTMEAVGIAIDQTFLPEWLDVLDNVYDDITGAGTGAVYAGTYDDIIIAGEYDDILTVAAAHAPDTMMPPMGAVLAYSNTHLPPPAPAAKKHTYGNVGTGNTATDSGIEEDEYDDIDIELVYDDADEYYTGDLYQNAHAAELVDGNRRDNLVPVHAPAKQIFPGPKDVVWVQERVLGKGAYGTVIQTYPIYANGTRGESVARKLPNIDRLDEKHLRDLSDLETERSTVLVLSRNNDHIIRPASGDDENEFDVFGNIWLQKMEDGKPVYTQPFAGFPLELMDGTLEKSLPTMTEERKVKCTVEMLETEAYLAEQSVVHFDIKPDNWLFSKKKGVKLSDFGLSKHLETVGHKKNQLPVKRYTAAIAHAAPELARTKVEDGVYLDGHKLDIWSLGITFAEMFTGMNPMKSPYMRQAFEARWRELGLKKRLFHAGLLDPIVLQNELDRFIAQHQHELGPVTQMVAEMLNQNPDARPDAHSLLERYRHIYAGMIEDVEMLEQKREVYMQQAKLQPFTGADRTYAYGKRTMVKPEMMNTCELHSYAGTQIESYEVMGDVTVPEARTIKITRDAAGIPDSCILHIEDGLQQVAGNEVVFTCEVRSNREGSAVSSIRSMTDRSDLSVLHFPVTTSWQSVMVTHPMYTGPKLKGKDLSLYVGGHMASLLKSEGDWIEFRNINLKPQPPTSRRPSARQQALKAKSMVDITERGTCELHALSGNRASSFDVVNCREMPKGKVIHVEHDGKETPDACIVRVKHGVTTTKDSNVRFTCLVRAKTPGVIYSGLRSTEDAKTISALPYLVTDKWQRVTVMHPPCKEQLHGDELMFYIGAQMNEVMKQKGDWIEFADVQLICETGL
ncbi:protein kinase domain-containing protein [Endozoicomonadaceae bacterium StTr2]